MKAWIKYWFITFAFLLTTHAQLHAQGTTAFTYQGQLHDSGTNANGTYTMIFRLYDAGTNGTQVGSTLTTSNNLINGLFTVNLDFGNVFTNGNARWLDITVTNGGVTQILSPRIWVLPAPFAQFATLAGNITGTLPSTSLGGAYSNTVSFNNSTNTFTGAFTGNGSAVTNIPASAIVGLAGAVNNLETYKAVVQEATTTTLPAYIYNNAAGTITGTSVGALTIDGIAVQQNDSVLVKNEPHAATNGIYVCTGTGSPTLNYILTRRSDFNTSTNIASGDTVLVMQGAANTNTTWTLTTTGAVTIGITPLNFVSVIAGVGSVNNLNGNVVLAAGNNASIFTNGNALTFSVGIPNIQLFRQVSNATFTVPTNVTRIMVEMWGGGGGGGLGYNSPISGNGIGGGGGAGAYSLGVFTVAPGSSYSVTATAPVNGGQNGNATTFTGNSIAMTASGGTAGGNASNTANGNGGNGGTSSGGNVLNSSGGSGDNNGNGGAVWRGAGVALQSGNGSQGPGGGGAGAGPSGSGQGGNSGAVFVYY
jgi:hypothetical protein